MKRYAVSIIIGDGLTDQTMFRPEASTISGISYAVVIAPDQATNTRKQWVLCVLAGTQAMIEAANTLPNTIVLTFGPNENTNPWLSVGNQNYRQSLATNIRSRTDYSIARDDPRTIGEVITDLGRDLDSNFHADRMNMIDNY